MTVTCSQGRSLDTGCAPTMLHDDDGTPCEHFPSIAPAPVVLHTMHDVREFIGSRPTPAVVKVHDYDCPPCKDTGFRLDRLDFSCRHAECAQMVRPCIEHVCYSVEQHPQRFAPAQVVLG